MKDHITSNFFMTQMSYTRLDTVNIWMFARISLMILMIMN